MAGGGAGGAGATGPAAALGPGAGRVWGLAWRPPGGAGAGAAAGPAGAGGDRFPLVSCGADGSVAAWAEGPGGVWGACGGAGQAGGRTLRALAWSPDGCLLAVAGFDACVTVWSPPYAGADADGPWELWATLEGHESEVKGVAWNASGSMLATCGRDKTVWIWERVGDPGPNEGDVCDFECVEVLQGHEADVKCLAWHPREDMLVTGSYDGSLRVWCEEEGCGGEWVCTQVVEGERTVWDVGFEPGSGCALASCDDEGAVALWAFDPASARAGSAVALATRVEGVHSGPAYSLDWDPTPGAATPRLATAGADGNLAVLLALAPDGDVRGAGGPPARLEVDRHIPAHAPREANCVRWRKVGRPGGATAGGARAALLASAGDDELVRLWDLGPAPA